MTDNNIKQERPQKSEPQQKDKPKYLKFILLFFLLILLIIEIASGEFGRFPYLGVSSWLILIIKLILIFLLILLIKLQKALNCSITAPTGCAEEEPDATAGILFISVKGTASGAVFNYYTLDISNGGPPIAGVVSYPGGGASGTAQVFGGVLGTINTTSLSDGAYTITLRVYPIGGGPAKVCTTTFNLLKAIIYINRVAGVQTIVLANNPNPFDTSAELRAVPPQINSIGGSMHIRGSAYIYECPARKIKKYEIRYAKVNAPGTEPPQPNKGDIIPGNWPIAQRIVLLEYTTPDQYTLWTRVGPASNDLINTWTIMTIGITTYPKLSPSSWGSGAAGSGRFSLLLTAEDTTGITFHDIQHVWLDNKPIIGQVVKLQKLVNGVWTDIPPCTDILLSYGTIRIVGLAWDDVIDDIWPLTDIPNDNFGYYTLDLRKQFGVNWLNIINSTVRVPVLPVIGPVTTPTVADADEIAQLILSTLDAGPIPVGPYTPPVPDYKLYRTQSCTYILQLFVTDKTIVNEGTTHRVFHQVPLKLVNDIV